MEQGDERAALYFALKCTNLYVHFGRYDNSCTHTSVYKIHTRLFGLVLTHQHKQFSCLFYLVGIVEGINIVNHISAVPVLYMSFVIQGMVIHTRVFLLKRRQKFYLILLIKKF
jgi:hypothetical protein